MPVSNWEMGSEGRARIQIIHIYPCTKINHPAHTHTNTHTHTRTHTHTHTHTRFGGKEGEKGIRQAYIL